MTTVLLTPMAPSMATTSYVSSNGSSVRLYTRSGRSRSFVHSRVRPGYQSGSAWPRYVRDQSASHRRRESVWAPDMCISMCSPPWVIVPIERICNSNREMYM